jgi:hypothetical protein
MSVDNDPITNIDLNCRDRPLPIDANNWALEGIIGIGSNPADVKIKFLGGSKRKLKKGKKQCCLN